MNIQYQSPESKIISIRLPRVICGSEPSLDSVTNESIEDSGNDIEW